MFWIVTVALTACRFVTPEKGNDTDHAARLGAFVRSNGEVPSPQMA